MAAAVRFVNSLPGRYCAGLFGERPSLASTMPVHYRHFIFSCQSVQHHDTVLLIAGISSGAKAALFYAAQVSNVPAVFMAEPDDLVVLSGQPSAFCLP